MVTTGMTRAYKIYEVIKLDEKMDFKDVFFISINKQMNNRVNDGTNIFTRIVCRNNSAPSFGTTSNFF